MPVGDPWGPGQQQGIALEADGFDIYPPDGKYRAEGVGGPLHTTLGGGTFEVTDPAVFARILGQMIGVPQWAGVPYGGQPQEIPPRDGPLLGAGVDGIFAVFGGAGFRVPDRPAFNRPFPG